MEKRLQDPLLDSVKEIEAEIDYWHERKQQGAFASGSIFDDKVTARLERLKLRAKQLEASEKTKGDPMSSSLNPLAVLREAIKAVPAVKYALGIAGVMAALALGAAFFSSVKAALFGVVAMLILMVLLVVFAAVTKLGGSVVRLPALVLTWAILTIFVGATTLAVTSVFFDYPRPFPELMKQLTGPSEGVSVAPPVSERQARQDPQYWDVSLEGLYRGESNPLQKIGRRVIWEGLVGELGESLQIYAAKENPWMTAYLNFDESQDAQIHSLGINEKVKVTGLVQSIEPNPERPTPTLRNCTLLPTGSARIQKALDAVASNIGEDISGQMLDHTRYALGVRPTEGILDQPLLRELVEEAEALDGTQPTSRHFANFYTAHREDLLRLIRQRVDLPAPVFATLAPSKRVGPVQLPIYGGKQVRQTISWWGDESHPPGGYRTDCYVPSPPAGSEYVEKAHVERNRRGCPPPAKHCDSAGERCDALVVDLACYVNTEWHEWYKENVKLSGLLYSVERVCEAG